VVEFGWDEFVFGWLTWFAYDYLFLILVSLPLSLRYCIEQVGGKVVDSVFLLCARRPLDAHAIVGVLDN